MSDAASTPDVSATADASDETATEATGTGKRFRSKPFPITTDLETRTLALGGQQGDVAPTEAETLTLTELTPAQQDWAMFLALKTFLRALAPEKMQEAIADFKAGKVPGTARKNAATPKVDALDAAIAEFLVSDAKEKKREMTDEQAAAIVAKLTPDDRKKAKKNPQVQIILARGKKVDPTTDFLSSLSDKVAEAA